MATLHACAMTTPAPWRARDFAGFLATPGVFLIGSAHGFALGRVTLDEAELLTLAVEPAHQRAGIGAQLLAGFEESAHNLAAKQAFLEVAANNSAAKALYAKSGWRETGLRRGYYRAKPARIDAILMRKALKSS